MQELTVNRHDAGVDLGDRQFAQVCILVLDDTSDLTARITHDSAVARRVFEGDMATGHDSIDPATTEKVVHMGRRAAIWNNTGDLLELIDANGITVASKGYGDFLRGGA